MLLPMSVLYKKPTVIATTTTSISTVIIAMIVIGIGIGIEINYYSVYIPLSILVYLDLNYKIRLYAARNATSHP